MLILASCQTIAPIFIPLHARFKSQKHFFFWLLYSRRGLRWFKNMRFTGHPPLTPWKFNFSWYIYAEFGFQIPCKILNPSCFLIGRWIVHRPGETFSGVSLLRGMDFCFWGLPANGRPVPSGFASLRSLEKTPGTTRQTPNPHAVPPYILRTMVRLRRMGAPAESF